MPSYTLNVCSHNGTPNRIKIWTSGITSFQRLNTLLLTLLPILIDSINDIIAIDILQGNVPVFFVHYDEFKHDNRDMCVELTEEHSHLIKIRMKSYLGFDYDESKFYLRNPNINAILKISIT